VATHGSLCSLRAHFGLGFNRGRKEFAHDHCLMLGHFLVFTYDGQSEFSVGVFSTSDVKDKTALKI
jgi:hypothetical protein